MLIKEWLDGKAGMSTLRTQGRTSANSTKCRVNQSTRDR